MIEHGKNMRIPPSLGVVPLPLDLGLVAGCGKKDDARGATRIAFFFNNQQAVL